MQAAILEQQRADWQHSVVAVSTHRARVSNARTLAAVLLHCTATCVCAAHSHMSAATCMHMYNYPSASGTHTLTQANTHTHAMYIPVST